jgi:hypothetical protein
LKEKSSDMRRNPQTPNRTPSGALQNGYGLYYPADEKANRQPGG